MTRFVFIYFAGESVGAMAKGRAGMHKQGVQVRSVSLLLQVGRVRRSLFVDRIISTAQLAVLIYLYLMLVR